MLQRIEDEKARRHARSSPPASNASPAGDAHDRRLRGSATGRHRAEQHAAQIGRTRGQQLAIRVDRRIGSLGEGPPRGDRLGEAHQRYTGVLAQTTENMQ
jgi:hypothetical protein